MQLITSKVLPPLAAGLALSITKHDNQLKVSLGMKYCPTMDLIATYPVIEQLGSVESPYTKDNTQSDPYAEDDDMFSVDVWRLNGQKVFGVSLDAEGYDTTRIDPTDVCWRADGQILAILSSDNMIRLVNSFSGKVMHKVSCSSSYGSFLPPLASFGSSQGSGSSLSQQSKLKQRPQTLSCLLNFLKSSSTSGQLAKFQGKDGVTLDDILSLNADIKKLLNVQADLPLELATIDVEAFLPRLACLPPIGYGLEDVFSARSSIDAIFHTSKRNLKGDTIDILATGFDKGRLHLRIFDAFEVGDIETSSASDMPQGYQCDGIIKIINHPLVERLFVVAKLSKAGLSSNLHLFALDLKFMAHASAILPVLVTKATQLSNLLRYLTQVQQQLAREVKTAFDLPLRFLRNLNEDLASQDGEGSTFSTAAYHSVVTGETTGTFKAWMNEQLMDRGVKRWEKAVGDCLELVRRLVSEAWNPAIERSGVVVSRLTGLSGWQSMNESGEIGLGIDKTLVESLKDTIDVMGVCGEDLLLKVNNELATFNSFIKWLRWEVEAAGLEDTSERLDEMRENCDHSDISKILEYIENNPADTVIKKYIGEAVKDDTPHDGNDHDFYTKFEEQRRKGVKALPTFDKLIARMKSQCDRLFERIASTLRKSVILQYLTPLPTGIYIDRMDIKVTAELQSGAVQVHVTGVDDEMAGNLKYTVYDAVRINQTTLYGSDTTSTSSRSVPGMQEILDVKFVDDEQLIVLASGSGQIHLLSHPVPLPLQNPAWTIRHTFKDCLMEGAMQPAHLEINGRKGRRAIVVGDHAGRGYCVYDLDTINTNATEEDEQMNN